MQAVGTIYLVRHGETEWNREGRLQGQSNSALTRRGLKQAHGIGMLLRQLIGAGDGMPVIASPLERALRTAEAICGPLGRDLASLQTDDLLKEISFGRWEGMTFAEIAAADPENWRRFEQDRWRFAPPGGESYAMVAERARRWLHDSSAIREKIVVAHGEFGRVLRGLYRGMSSEEMFALDVPQDVVFRLSAGTIERIGA
jgi:probable phosphoglycerate mutase